MGLLYICIVLAGYSVVYSWDIDSGDFEKRQIVPLPRIGRSYYEAKRQGLIPSPRVGRSSPSSYNGISRDCTIDPESCNKLKTYKNLHEVHEGVPVLDMHALATRSKRSPTIEEDFENDIKADEFELTKTLRSNPWDWGIEPEDDFFQRNSRQLIPAPRMGRSGSSLKNRLISGFSSSADEDMVIDPIDLQLRAAFIPRLGKRSSHQSYDQWSDLNNEYKRAAAFTPRIGRAAFVPRIGKKAAFVPRIGRSSAKNDNDLGANHLH